MTDVTKKAIIALVSVDETATKEEREFIARALAGDMRPIARVIKLGEAADRLGRTVRTVQNLIATGRLAGVKGAGKNLIGVTEASFEQYVCNTGLDV